MGQKPMELMHCISDKSSLNWFSLSAKAHSDMEPVLEENSCVPGAACLTELIPSQQLCDVVRMPQLPVGM